MSDIVQIDNPVLRKIAEKVLIDEIRGKKIAKIIEAMKKAVDVCNDGVAIAAPQIGKSLQIFVVSPRAFIPPDDEMIEEKLKQIKHLVFINPKILKLSSKTNILDEGCLSVRGTFGKIRRSEKATIEAYDENGKKIVRGASGLLAEIFQHEIDHLNGILFTDKATTLYQLVNENNIHKSKTKLLFWGTPEFSVHILDELERNGIIPNAVVTSPDMPKGRKLLLTPPPVKVWASKRNIPVFQPVSLKDFSINEEYDLFILAGYGKFIPEKILNIPKKGVLNIHPSLLPSLRGPSPLQSAILGGVEETGVSIILLDKEMDHGPILKTKKIDLKNSKPTYIELEKTSAELGAKMLSEIIPGWLENKLKAIPQDHTKATFCKKIEKKDGFIDSDIILGKEVNLEKILLAERKVRALNPDPGTFTILTFHGKELRVKITKAKVEENKFIPERVIPEGKKEMSWNDFLNGHQIA